MKVACKCGHKSAVVVPAANTDFAELQEQIARAITWCVMTCRKCSKASRS